MRQGKVVPQKYLYHVGKFRWYRILQMWHKTMEVISLRTKIAELRPQKHQSPFQKFKKLSCREVRSTVVGNTMLSWDYSTFLDGDRQNKCLSGMFRGVCDVWSTLKSTTFLVVKADVRSSGGVGLTSDA